MERRDFLKLIGVGSVPSAASAFPRVNDDVVDAKSLGAVGDGINDDTISLQAAIDQAIAAGRSCFIPAGTYKITSPLVVGRAGMTAYYHGFRLFGEGNAVARRTNIGGTVIRLAGNGHRAVLALENRFWRGGQIADLAVECIEKNGADHGLLFDGTQFSGHLVENVGVYNAKIAFGIRQGRDGNGEFTMFSNCHATYVDGFFRSDAGQAYVQHFHHCSCFLNNGGIYFHLDLSIGGGGINVVDFNAGTERARGGSSDTLLVKNTNSDSCLNFYGGRIEKLTQLYEHKGGTTDLHVAALFQGLEITFDRTATAEKPFVDISRAPDIVSINSCKFQGITGREALNVQTLNSWAYVFFRECIFIDLAQPPFAVSNFNDMFNQVAFENCKSIASKPDKSPRRPLPFDRHMGGDLSTWGRSKPYSENSWIHSGKPANLLIKPHFTGQNGNGLKAEAPWVHFGGQLSFNAYDWNHAGPHTQSSSPWAKLIELPPASGIYQDIDSVDLSASAVARNFNGIDIIQITYQAMIARLAGNADLRFSLSDSESGQVYDETSFKMNSGNVQSTRLVTLAANVTRKSSRSVVRFKLENLSQRPATIEFMWQLAAATTNPSFVGSDTAPTLFDSPWAMNAESGRFWHRLSVPYKTDRFGSESSRNLENLQSDIYLSKSTEKFTSFANGRWWVSPRMSSASSIPVDGRWAQGDIVFNSEPAAGSSLGWVQVAAGQFSAETAWAPGMRFEAGARVYNRDGVYNCVQGGISAAGDGPRGTTGAVQDGSCTWSYVGLLAPVACGQAWAPRAYRAGDRVHSDGNVYECIRAGDSAVSPASSDGATRWRFVGKRAEFKVCGWIEK